MVRKIIFAVSVILFLDITTFQLLQINATFFIYGIVEILCYGLFILVIFLLLFDAVVNKPNTGIKRYSLPLFSVSLFAVTFLTGYLIKSDGGKSTLLSANVNHDLTFIHLDLYNNNSFKLLNSGPFWGQFYRGNYRLENDTLTLDNAELVYLYPSLKLVRKRENKKEIFEPCDSNYWGNTLYINED